jgi:Putative beta-barrel porin-2, OmpL-like. bbp2/Carboxypeptidase regulatory-like domain
MNWRAFRSPVRPQVNGLRQIFTRSSRASLRQRVVFGLLIGVAACAVGVVVPAAAQNAAPTTPYGTLVGVVRNAGQQVVPGATVTVKQVGGTEIRATISGEDGVYAFADLPPGRWSLTFQADGYPQAVAPPVVVVASQATRADYALGGSTAVAATAAPPAAPVSAAPVSAPPAPTVAAVPVAAAPAPTIPEALQAPAPGPALDLHTPPANVPDIGWMNGQWRESSPIFDTKFFTPEIRFDTNYLYSLNDPHDHTIVGSTEEFRSGEFQIEQVSFGGNFHWNGVQARFLSMMGDFATTTPRNDASSAVGQWDLSDAYRYFSEANAGYHWDNVGHGLNVDAGIFVSYIGLFSYYNFDNWTYQPSYVSSNTPWFFNGLRIQYWPTQNLKIEPWLINGWQSYAKFNHDPGFGGQILYIPTDDVKWVFNTYMLGEDNLSSGSGIPNNAGGTVAIGLANPTAPYINYAHVHRFHEDDSYLLRYYQAGADQNGAGISQMAFSLTWDFGCEYGGGVECWKGPNKANFLGTMFYNRIWWDHNRLAVTLGGGAMNNPGRYLALLPPINGATAASGSPYFTENPGQPLFQWDSQLNLQYMPKDWITWWVEATYRHSDVPYFSGSGGVTPPDGNNGSPGSLVCNNGSAITSSSNNCASEGGIWYPDLRTSETVLGAGILVKF